MPGGISGVSLARTARELRPELAILLSSGFTGEGAVTENMEFQLLDKPYGTGTMAAKLRKLLDNRQAARATPGWAAA
jgi:hypothetical protein